MLFINFIKFSLLLINQYYFYNIYLLKSFINKLLIVFFFNINDFLKQNDVLLKKKIKNYFFLEIYYKSLTYKC